MKQIHKIYIYMCVFVVWCMYVMDVVKQENTQLFDFNMKFFFFFFEVRQKRCRALRKKTSNNHSNNNRKKTL